MDDFVLVDTSVWVEYFRGGRSATTEALDLLLADERVAIVGVIRAELLSGTRDDRAFEELRELLTALQDLGEPPALWETVGRWGAQLRRGGLGGVGIPDLVIGVTALHYAAPVLTLDRHFEALARVFGVPLLG